MWRERMARCQKKDDLRPPSRIAVLLSPERMQRIDYGTDGWFILRQKVGYVFVRTRTPVRAHSSGFQCTHFNAERSHFLGQGFGESADRPLRSMVRRATGKSQPTAQG